MLVLSRKVGESIVIPDLGITITIVGTGSSRVRVGIDAPRDVAIHRQEVSEALASAGSAEAKLPRSTAVPANAACR